MTSKLFSELGLSAELLKAIDKLGFEQASPIQAEAIPVLMSGRDVVGQSQTGSGKTAAFAIPAIEKTDAQLRSVQVLILCPTRELAVQVSEDVHALAIAKRGIRALPIYGGQSYERQFHGLQDGAQIVIGTPGRVMDHMRRGTLRLDQLRMAILDEVDVMLNMGFREDIEFILQATPAARQTVFFSATIPRPIQDLIQKYARDPHQIRIEPKAVTAPTVEQVYYEIDRRFKVELLTRLIDLHDYKLGIIFCNTKRMVDDLVDHLNAQGYSADRLHGDMGQNMRDRVMNRFRKSGLEFLVATDVAARGIDVDDVQVVVNYDLPYDPEDYVHRIGRTGRAGRSGRAISFVAGRELFQIQQIERFTKSRIQRSKIPTADEVQEARTNVFLGKLRATLQSGEFERHDELVGRLLEEGFTSTDIASALIHHLQKESTSAVQPTATPIREEGRSGRPPRSDDRRLSNRDDDRRDRWDRPDSRRDQPGRDYRDSRGDRGDFRDSRREQPSRYDDRRPGAPYNRPAAPYDRPSRPSRPPAAKAAQVSPAASESSSPVVKPTAESAPTAPAKPIASPAESEPIKEVAIARPAPRTEDSSKSESSAVRAPKAFAERPAKSAKPIPAAPRPTRGPAALGKPEAHVEKASRRTPSDQTRLFINVGQEMGVVAGDVVGAILGETGLPSQTVGVVDVRERHLFVDVAANHANSIISKLNRSTIKGRRIKVKIA